MKRRYTYGTQILFIDMQEVYNSTANAGLDATDADIALSWAVESALYDEKLIEVYNQRRDFIYQDYNKFLTF